MQMTYCKKACGTIHLVALKNTCISAAITKKGRNHNKKAIKQDTMVISHILQEKNIFLKKLCSNLNQNVSHCLTSAVNLVK